MHFTQSRQWADFWQHTKHKNYKLYELQEKSFVLFIYEYPWLLGQKYWYIPQLTQKLEIYSFKTRNYLSIAKLGKELQVLILKIINLAQKEKVAFIQLELNWQLSEFLDIKNSQEAIDLLRKILFNFPPQFIKLSSKKQSEQSLVLNLQGLKLDEQKTEPEITCEEIKNFYLFNRDNWFKNHSKIENIYTDIINQNCLISIEKNQENFETFWYFYNQNLQTKKQPKNKAFFLNLNKLELQYLYKAQFSSIIVLNNNARQPLGVWFGIRDENTAYCLYKYNQQESSPKILYFLDLIAIKLLVENKINCYSWEDINLEQVAFLDKDLKENYGPIHLILKPKAYFLTNLINKFWTKMKTENSSKIDTDFYCKQSFILSKT